MNTLWFFIVLLLLYLAPAEWLHVGPGLPKFGSCWLGSRLHVSARRFSNGSTGSEFCCCHILCEVQQQLRAPWLLCDAKSNASEYGPLTEIVRFEIDASERRERRPAQMTKYPSLDFTQHTPSYAKSVAPPRPKQAGRTDSKSFSVQKT